MKVDEYLDTWYKKFVIIYNIMFKFWILNNISEVYYQTEILKGDVINLFDYWELQREDDSF